MNDTSPEIQKKLNEIYKNKSGEEKLLIALKMFETARSIVLSSLPGNLSEDEIRRELFLRFYGNEFDDLSKEKILESFRKVN
jgi:hypothetical protein